MLEQSAGIRIEPVGAHVATIHGLAACPIEIDVRELHELRVLMIRYLRSRVLGSEPLSEQ